VRLLAGTRKMHKSLLCAVLLSDVSKFARAERAERNTKSKKIALFWFLSLSLQKQHDTKKKKRILIHSFTSLSLSLSLSPPRDERTPAHEQLPVDIYINIFTIICL